MLRPRPYGRGYGQGRFSRGGLKRVEEVFWEWWVHGVGLCSVSGDAASTPLRARLRLAGKISHGGLKRFGNGGPRGGYVNAWNCRRYLVGDIRAFVRPRPYGRGYDCGGHFARRAEEVLGGCSRGEYGMRGIVGAAWLVDIPRCCVHGLMGGATDFDRGELAGRFRDGISTFGRVGV
jgi:hypothetical protein